MKVKGNRIEVGDWFILIKPMDFLDVKFKVKHKHKNIAWDFDTLEEAWEKVNERV